MTSFGAKSAQGTAKWRLLLPAVSSWLERGSISRQSKVIFRSSALLVVLLGLAAALGFMRTEQRANRSADLTEFAFLISDMSQNVRLSKDNMGAYRARGYEDEIINLSIEQAQQAIALNASLREIAGSIDPAYVPRIDALRSDLSQVERIMEEIKSAPRDIVEEESFLGPKYDFIDTTIGKIVDLGADAAGRVEDVSSDGIWEIRALIIAMVVIAALALGLVLVGQNFVARRIIDPIGNISSVSLQVADGDTDSTIPETERDDEIGTMARSLRVMQEKSAALVVAQKEIAEKATVELEAQRAVEDERAKQAETLRYLADKFERTVGNVAQEVGSATNQLQAAATSMAENAERSSEESRLAAGRLKEASSGVIGAAAASDEFVLSINEISRQASTSAKRARDANAVATQANATISQLDSSAAEVSGIVEMIAGIAQRTNMLALNATIEAARSGEAGRGFAVVASEVKELAAQTSKATEQVEQQIKAIQKSSGAGVDALRAIVAEITELETTAISIASAVDQQSVAGQDIAKSIDLAARSTEAVNENVSLVSNMSSETGAAATQLLGSADHLERQTVTLRDQVAEFLKHVRSA